jgi:hypothetical protein
MARAKSLSSGFARIIVDGDSGIPYRYQINERMISTGWPTSSALVKLPQVKS